VFQPNVLFAGNDEMTSAKSNYFDLKMRQMKKTKKKPTSLYGKIKRCYCKLAGIT